VTVDRVASFLDDLRLVSEDRHDLVFRLRKLILEVDPGVSEQIKYGGILFTAGSPLCGVFAYTHHVALEFGRGAELPDPHRVLEGDGKHRRHIKITAQPDIFRKNVRGYVVLALENLRAVRGAQRGALPRARPPG
jgi:hypothetical protein